MGKIKLKPIPGYDGLATDEGHVWTMVDATAMETPCKVCLRDLSEDCIIWKHKGERACQYCVKIEE